MSDLRQALVVAERCGVLADISIREVQMILDNADAALVTRARVAETTGVVEAYYSAVLDALDPPSPCVRAELDAGP